jgi:signal transduction histidine kinase/CheY-like chemotaxis protein/HPt (histidine-containing phosphotransfer) domain-containing protein
MSDLLFESINLAVICGAFIFILRASTQMGAEQRKGWYFVISGFLFLIFGHIVDILDEFNQFKDLDILEEAFGIMPGYILLTIGFYRWFPEVVKLKKTEEKLRKVNDALAHRMEERRQAMVELAKARDQAEEANQSKDAFLATISHEIRTPMNIVLGMLELLKDAKLNQKYREYLHLSTTAGKRLLFLINDLLDFAQIDRGKFNLDHRDFDLRKLMDDVTMILSPLASAKGVELTAHISSHLPTAFRGDQNRLGQIFTNLIANAIKFTPAGGSVDLHGGPIGKHDNKTEFMFEIRDTGEGIPEDKREAIFNRFTQIDSSTSRNHEGTGLGLAISKHLVNMMNGNIGTDANIHSKSGSTFYFTIVLENQAETTTKNNNDLPLEGYTIHLHDCEGLQLTMLTDHLEMWGAKIDTKHDSDISPDKFDLVIVNHKPDNKEDFIPLHFLSTDSRLVILTDLLDQAWDQAATCVGPITCLQKPVSAERLLNSILNPQIEDHNYVHSAAKHHITPEGSILIVDDQATNLLLTKALLEKIGFPEDAIDLADSGKKALELIANKSYQLVLLDLRMPNMDGFQTAKAIGEIKFKKGIKPPSIIAFTGDITKKSRKKCTQAGMAGVLAKPTSLSDLRAVVKEHFTFTLGNEKKRQELEGQSSELSSALESMGLPTENHREVAEVLSEQLPSLINSLNTSIMNQEEEQARATAHVLKGSMANVLFPTLKEPSVLVHKQIKKKDWQQAKEELRTYRTILNPIMHSIQYYLQNNIETEEE